MYERYRKAVCYLSSGLNIKACLKIWKNEFLIGPGPFLSFKRSTDDLKWTSVEKFIGCLQTI